MPAPDPCRSVAPSVPSSRPASGTRRCPSSCRSRSAACRPSPSGEAPGTTCPALLRVLPCQLTRKQDPERYEAALIRADRGKRSWVSEPKIDSCHTVWMELHEDLLATLGVQRGG